MTFSLNLPFCQKSSQSAPRRTCFRRDIRLTDAQASHCSDYVRSGFDRGHMGPKADFDSYDVNDETVMNSYLLSNIAPQYRGFNGGKSEQTVILKLYNKQTAPKSDHCIAHFQCAFIKMGFTAREQNWTSVYTCTYPLKISPHSPGQ